VACAYEWRRGDDLEIEPQAFEADDAFWFFEVGNELLAVLRMVGAAAFLSLASRHRYGQPTATCGRTGKAPAFQRKALGLYVQVEALGHLSLKSFMQRKKFTAYATLRSASSLLARQMRHPEQTRIADMLREAPQGIGPRSALVAFPISPLPRPQTNHRRRGK